MFQNKLSYTQINAISFMMTFTVESQIALLEVLKNASPKLQRAILKNSDSKLIDALSEICFNYLKGNVKSTDTHFKKLKKYKTTIRKLGGSCNKKVCKRKVLLQSGSGFFGLLLAPLVTELAGYVTRKFLR